MAKKLWSVTVRCEFEVPVLAETEEEALGIAGLNYMDEVARGDAMEFDAVEVTSVGSMPSDFRGAIPWGTDDDETCEHVLASTEETAR